MRDENLSSGHFGCTCYNHPLFCFNQFGDVERVLLRDGNVHSAKDWRAVLKAIEGGNHLLRG